MDKIAGHGKTWIFKISKLLQWRNRVYVVWDRQNNTKGSLWLAFVCLLICLFTTGAVVVSTYDQFPA